MTAPSEPEDQASGPLSPCGRILLARLESVRDRIARSIVRDHPEVTGPDLNYLTVRALLQILMLRTCQVYGFAEPETLALLAECAGIGKRMGRACADAGLTVDFFAYGPAGPRPFPELPDQALREAIGILCHQEIPVPAVDISPEELAVVLEHLLGTRLEVGEGYRVLRTGKSALLYTGSIDVPPREVVEYTVAKAIREVAGSSPENRAAPFRILDPSCGAGLFLLETFRHLIRRTCRGGNHGLTPEGLQEILTGSVFGTDIDPESVSAARFILLLAFMEDCRTAGLPPLSQEQIAETCCSLQENIRCGNALIAPDYFHGKPVFPFNAEEHNRVNAFDWRAAFTSVIVDGGFDLVLGAPPPYRPFAVKAREEYFQTHYDTYAATAGLYGYFIERGIRLLRSGGILAVLVPGAFLRSGYARPLRRFLLGRQIVRIARSGTTRLLQEGEVMIHILLLRNQSPKDPVLVSPEVVSGRQDFLLDQSSLDDGGWRLEDSRAARILEKICSRGTMLETYVIGEIGTGIYDDQNDPLIVDRKTRSRLMRSAPWARRFFIPLLGPEDIRSYYPEKTSRFVISAGGNPEKMYRCRALREFIAGIGPVHAAVFSQPEHDRPLSPVRRHPKIIFSLFHDRPVFVFDPRGIYAATTALGIIHRNDPYLAGILNSSLGRFVLTHICPFTDRGYHVSPESLGKFPVMVPDFDKLTDKSRHDKLLSLVTHILELNRYLPQARTDQERRLVQQEIDATDVRINALVYELYGLTSDEIAVVERSSPS